jgi:hypothetical protein
VKSDGDGKRVDSVTRRGLGISQKGLASETQPTPEFIDSLLAGSTMGRYLVAGCRDELAYRVPTAPGSNRVQLVVVFLPSCLTLDQSRPMIGGDVSAEFQGKSLYFARQS